MNQFYTYLLILIGLLVCSLSSQAQSIRDSKRDVIRLVKNDEVKIFPNPAIDRFTINIPGSHVKFITINNIIGKEVKKMTASSNQSYEVSDLKRGVYIIRIFDTNDELIKALRLSKA